MKDAYLINNPKGAFGRVKGVDLKSSAKIKTKYYQHDTDYQITQGL